MEAEAVPPVWMNIYKSNIYRKDLNWLHFNNGLKEAQVKNQQSYTPVTASYLTYPKQLRAPVQTEQYLTQGCMVDLEK